MAKQVVHHFTPVLLVKLIALNVRLVPEERKPEIRQRLFSFLEEEDFSVSILPCRADVSLRPARSLDLNLVF